MTKNIERYWNQYLIPIPGAQEQPFDEVTADYARDGGEGDRCLESWREIYWECIEREFQRIGLEPNTKAPLVTERFRVVSAEPSAWRATGEPASNRA